MEFISDKELIYNLYFLIIVLNFKIVNIMILRE